ncbi:MAG: histidine--tRNA ligase [Bacillota bacterium]
MLISRPRGTNDILPGDAGKWRHAEATFREVCRRYSYGEIRTPVFEHTELFQRGVGESTDIVQKEMYTFTDRGNRSITLKAEGTAPTVRAYLENKLHADPQPVKMFYICPIFRYERPQAGRLRQHHQLGVEAIGSAQPSVDVETIALAMDFFEMVGLRGLEVRLNSIGCPRCRSAYRERLVKYLSAKEGLCPDCSRRLVQNPLRVLDCKRPECRALVQDSPAMGDYLCDECSVHLAHVQEYLGGLQVPFDLDPHLVRGLDYYTRTVFEIVHGALGAQGSVCSGGRYDGLAQECGGPPTPGVGFGLGIERLIMALEGSGVSLPGQEEAQCFVAMAGDRGCDAVTLVRDIRRHGIQAEMDHMDRSLKAQMRHAGRLGVRYTVIVGDEEAIKRRALVKEMASGQQEEVPFDKVGSFIAERIGV